MSDEEKESEIVKRISTLWDRVADLICAIASVHTEQDRTKPAFAEFVETKTISILNALESPRIPTLGGPAITLEDLPAYLRSRWVFGELAEYIVALQASNHSLMQEGGGDERST